MISIQELRDITGTPVEDEASLPLLKSVVVAQWESETGIKWSYAANHEMIFDVGRDPTRSVFIPAMNVTSVASVAERDLSVGSVFETVPTTDWIKIGDRQLRRLGGAEWSGLVKVVATVGYVDAPADIRRALGIQAKFLRERHVGPKFIEKYAQVQGAGSAGFLDADKHPAFDLAIRIHARIV